MIGFYFHRFRTLFWTVFYQTAGRFIFSSLGAGATFEGWIDIPQRGRISVGRKAYICRHVEFSVIKNAELIIEAGTFIGRGTVIGVHERVRIGAHSLIAEYVSIHDNNHGTRDLNLPISRQGFEAESLEIGSDCWLGAKTTLVKGSGMGLRCILGAGAVLTKKMPDHTTAAGVPARWEENGSLLQPAANRGELHAR